jgi:hypothetical protein
MKGCELVGRSVVCLRGVCNDRGESMEAFSKIFGRRRIIPEVSEIHET